MANTTIPTMPTAPNRSMDSPTFVATADTWVAALGPVTDAMNTLGTEIEADAISANTSAANAALSEAAAISAAASAASTSNVTVWVSGTTYAFGVSVISPITALTYRRIIAGAGTTDPSLDTTNWMPLSQGITQVSAVATSTTLTNISAGYIATAMTAIGQHIKLPDATTMATVGGPTYIIDNTKGGYSVGIRDSAGSLLMAVAPGCEAYVSLRDKTTSAGVWSVTGEGLEPGLMTVSTRLPSFPMTSTQPVQYVALDDNVSIHFAYWSGVSFYAFVVDNTGKTVTTPVVVTASGGQPVAAFKINSTQAIVFFGSGTTSHSAVVLTLSGSSPSYILSVGSPATTSTTMIGVWGGENSRGDPKIAQLSSTLYVVGAVQSASSNAYAQAIVVSGSTVSIGTVGASVHATAQVATTYPLTSTTALMLIKHAASTPFTISAVVVSVSGTTISYGTLVSTGLQSSNTASLAPSSVLLSPTKAMVMDNNNSTTGTVVAVTVSGTTVSAGTPVAVWSSYTPTVNYAGNAANRYNPHLWKIGPNTAGAWAKASSGFSGVSLVSILSESSGVITAGTVAHKSISSSTAGVVGSGQLLPQGASEFLAIKQTLPSSSNVGGGLVAIPSKISGTTTTLGSGTPIVDALQVNCELILMGKTTNGDYAILAAQTSGGNTDVIGNNKMVILRSNGDQAVYRGSISIPETWFPNITPLWNLPTVSANRFVLVAGGLGNPAAADVDTLQIVNVEIAV